MRHSPTLTHTRNILYSNPHLLGANRGKGVVASTSHRPWGTYVGRGVDRHYWGRVRGEIRGGKKKEESHTHMANVDDWQSHARLMP